VPYHYLYLSLPQGSHLPQTVYLPKKLPPHQWKFLAIQLELLIELFIKQAIVKCSFRDVEDSFSWAFAGVYGRAGHAIMYSPTLPFPITTSTVNMKDIQ
jgi:hypothetical protein